MLLLVAIIIKSIVTLIVYSVYVFLISFILWMTVDASKQDRFWWVVLIVGVPIIGAVLYYFTEKKHEYAKLQPHHIHTSATENQHEVSPKKH